MAAAIPHMPAIRLAAAGARFDDRNGRAAMLSNSFAFGGNNVVLAFGRGARHDAADLSDRKRRAASARP